MIDDPAARAGALLTIDLEALADNWRRLRDRTAPGVCAAVVKADAYGIGIDRAAPALWAAGCRVFFVALLDEGIRLRTLLPEAEIKVLGGLLPGTAEDFASHTLIPVLNDLGQIAGWSAAGRGLPCALHLDTGMSRLGLPPDEVATLVEEPHRVAGLDLLLILSHLACADTPNNPMNAAQAAEFAAALDRLRAAGIPAPASLAASSGVFLGPDYRHDLARPGIALYGGNPTPESPNPMAQVVRLQGKIVQVRTIDTPRTVGYGATHRAEGPTRIATVAAGYADGYLRAIGNRGTAFIDDHPAPVVGRVSMDLTTLDVTGIPEPLCRPGAFVDLIGPHNPVDAVAAAGGTISYEILTGLGRRYHRVYRGGPGT